tara:strand:- start:1 stop:624 length:624 start_codon:yes stop_codon:yes gene_type:complete
MLNFILKLIKKILKTPVRVLLPVLSFFITLYYFDIKLKYNNSLSFIFMFTSLFSLYYLGHNWNNMVKKYDLIKDITKLLLNPSNIKLEHYKIFMPFIIDILFIIMTISLCFFIVRYDNHKKYKNYKTYNIDKHKLTNYIYKSIPISLCLSILYILYNFQENFNIDISLKLFSPFIISLFLLQLFINHNQNILIFILDVIYYMNRWIF